MIDENFKAGDYVILDPQKMSDPYDYKPGIWMVNDQSKEGLFFLSCDKKKSVHIWAVLNQMIHNDTKLVECSKCKEVFYLSNIALFSYFGRKYCNKCAIKRVRKNKAWSDFITGIIYDNKTATPVVICPVDGNTYHPKTYAEYWISCANCHKVAPSQTKCRMENKRYCSKCFHMLFKDCETCGNTFESGDCQIFMFRWTCKHCIDMQTTKLRKWDTTYELTDGIERQYGVEIECIAPHDEDEEPDEYDDVEHPNMVTDAFESVFDGSLSPYGEEHRSVVLEGDDGIRIIEKECKSLAQNGYSVDMSCGLHVHISSIDLTYIQMCNIASFVRKYEMAIYATMCPSRLSGEFSGPMNMNLPLLRSLRTHPNPRKFIGQISNMDRYKGLNLSSFFKHGSIEFRYHGGTISLNKIHKWIKLCLHIIEYAKDKNCDNDLIYKDGRADGVLEKMMHELKLSKEDRSHWLERRAHFREVVDYERQKEERYPVKQEKIAEIVY